MDTQSLTTIFSFSHLVSIFLLPVGFTYDDAPGNLWLDQPESTNWTTLGADKATAGQDVTFSLSYMQGGLCHVCRTLLHTETHLSILGAWGGIFLLITFGDRVSFSSFPSNVDMLPCCLQAHHLMEG